MEHDEYSERWTFGVQQALTGTTLVEVIYEGNHAVHLPVSSQNINATELQYLTTNPYRDQNLATALSTAVTNPFAGLLPNGNSSYNGATTSLSNLLVPFPAFGSASINEEQLTNGQSFFESGMVHVEQRAQHGLTLTANYNFSKMIEQDVYNNSEDTKLYRGISPNEDYRHHFTVGGVYELPFGRGKLFSLGGGKLADEIAGGWVLNGIYQFQTGLPINFSVGYSVPARHVGQQHQEQPTQHESCRLGQSGANECAQRVRHRNRYQLHGICIAAMRWHSVFQRSVFQSL